MKPGTISVLLSIMLVFAAGAGWAQDLDSMLDSTDTDQSVTEKPPTPQADEDSPGVTTGTGPKAASDDEVLKDLLRRLKKFWEEMFGRPPVNFEIPGLPPTTSIPPSSTSTGSGTGTSTGTDVSTTSTGTSVDTGVGGTTIGTGLGDEASEDEYKTRAEKVIEILRSRGIKPGVGKGDSPAERDIPGFPDWFCELQDLLCGSNDWDEVQEEGRGLLRDYATRWAKANLPQPTHHALVEFFKYLGCAENNDKAIAAFAIKTGQSLPRSGMMGGEIGKGEWCAFASNKCFVDPITAAGFKVPGNYSWANQTKYIPQYGKGNPKFNIEIGDYITNGKHVMTAVQLRGDKILVVSGNAGGGSIAYSGTVRIEQVRLAPMEVDKKHAPLALHIIQEHQDDAAWLKARGISR